MVLRGVVLSLSMCAGLALGQTSIGPEPKCRADADCLITTFSGCCGGCCPAARSMSKGELESQQRNCAAVDCKQQVCAAVECEQAPAAESLEARCQTGRCVAVPRSQPRAQPPSVSPPPSQCSADRDCAVSYAGASSGSACFSSPCGCCPGTEPRAVPVAEKEVPPRRLSPPRKSGQPRPFGLSEGNTVQEPPTCAACPAQRPARAVCQAQRCVLAPAPAPMPPPPT